MIVWFYLPNTMLVFAMKSLPDTMHIEEDMDAYKDALAMIPADIAG